MLVKPTNYVATPFDAKAAKKLEACEDYHVFTEGGSHYVSAFRNGVLEVYAFLTPAQHARLLGLPQEENEFSSYYDPLTPRF